MNFLPKIIEDIIIDYKEDLERTEKFKKAIKPINNMRKHYLYQEGFINELEIYVDNHYLEPSFNYVKSYKDYYAKDDLCVSFLKYIKYNLRKGNIEYPLNSDWICLNKDMKCDDYKKTDYYNSFPEEF